MAQQINVEIQVKDTKIAPFSSLTLNQQFNGHHYFELRFNHDVVEQKNAVLINKSKDLLGEEITIAFSTKFDSGYPDNTFKGIITEISIDNNMNATGDLVFKGHSPTILLESGENNASFLDKNLNQIVKTAIGGVPGNVLSSAISPSSNTSIPYIVQYRESNFNFVRRLAAEYGEWFFYDGTKFNFGKPTSGGNVELVYPRDIAHLNLSVKMAPLNFEDTAYYSKDDTKFLSPSSSQNVAGLDTFGTAAQSASNKHYSKPVTALSLKPFAAKSELDDYVKAQKSDLAGGMVYVRAACDSPYIKLGTTLAISAQKVDKSTEDYGKFVVTSVVHTTDGLGNYTNVFEAVPSTLKVLPNPFSDKPIAEPQLAVVKSMKDPDNLGRVQVQLLWQKDGDTTPYLRVMGHSAGLGDSNKKNRGMLFIPEEGDYVVVGFEQNDPAQPFVMGSVHHGKAISTQGMDDNNTKAISTRSGNTIFFYDKESDKEQEIRIITDEKNYISIKVPNGKGAIQIFSTDTIEVQSETSITLKSKDIKISATNNIEMEANKDITIKAGNNLKMSGVKIAAEGSAGFEAKGAQVKIEGSATTAVKGAILQLEGSGPTTLKGAIVQIN